MGQGAWGGLKVWVWERLYAATLRDRSDIRVGT
jgi:hypothetical protein